jgi:hypothetical protein
MIAEGGAELHRYETVQVPDLDAGSINAFYKA